jgi:hypothetical protein
MIATESSSKDKEPQAVTIYVNETPYDVPNPPCG